MQEKKCVEDEKQNREIHRRKKSRAYFNYNWADYINFIDSVMTSKQKEKASELVEKYYRITDINFGIRHQKKCALIAIELEYHSLREQLFNLRSCGMIESDKVYLKRIQDLIDEEKEVKQEIEKL